MYKNILQKCLDELNNTPFKIDKVIGMLETLIEMDVQPQVIPSYPQVQPTPYPVQPWSIGNSPTYPMAKMTEVSLGARVIEDSNEQVDEVTKAYVGGRIAPLQ